MNRTIFVHIVDITVLVNQFIVLHLKRGKMKIKMTLMIELKDEGFLGFFKNIVVKSIINKLGDTTIENEMFHIIASEIEVMK